MICIEYVHSYDHDSSAGVGGRIGYRYCTEITVKMPVKYWNTLKKKKQIGSLVIDVANTMSRQFHFRQTYNPQVDTKARASKGFVSVEFKYFHNSHNDALKVNYDVAHGFMRHHLNYEKRNTKNVYNPSQYSLDPNNESEG